MLANGLASPVVVLDDAAENRLRIFVAPKAVIAAQHRSEIILALASIESARRAGNFVVGYFSYELGYALEGRLTSLLPSAGAAPLLWFGVFDAPTELAGQAATAALELGRAYAGPLRPEWDEAAYSARFARVKALIAAGDIYQANLSFRAHFGFLGEPLALYARLRQASAARYGAYIADGERHILSLSPELFFDLAPDGRITAKPMKGTAARGDIVQRDMLAREGLQESTKNRAENLMIVDLLRNDLSRIAEPGSVAVPSLFTVETYPTLHQMVSTVTAKLPSATTVEALLRALFPCGSITGAPKIRAMEVLAGLEQSPRGVYCGAIGCFAPDGSARFNVAIRTLTIAAGQGELGIGGGVVQDSEATSEYAEALLKARYYVAGRRPLELIETLRWSRAEGFVRGDLHLARLARSAKALGLSFDAARARDVLDEATFALALPEQEPRAHRLRLTLDEAGEIACVTAPLSATKALWRCTVSPEPLNSSDALARHKTNWRDLYEGEAARLCPPFDEVLFLNERGEVVEGSRTNIFVERNGVLLTPPLDAGALDGVLRQSLIAEGSCREAVLLPEDLSGGFHLGNSLRGLIKASF